MPPNPFELARRNALPVGLTTVSDNPQDWATLFAGLRSSVPLSMVTYSGEATSPDELAFEERNRAAQFARDMQNFPQPSHEELTRQAIEQFKLNYPTPELRAAALAHMRAVRDRGAYDPATATRRVDYLPETRHEVRATPSKKKYNKGGSVKKTAQQMKDELLLKGVRFKEPVDLGRRSLFGLRPQQDFPLAEIEKHFAKEGQAPTVTKSTTSVSPDAGETSKTVEKLIETPVSRRQVLKTGASQLVQGALPKGALPTPLGGAEEIVQQAAQTIVPRATQTIVPRTVTEAMAPGIVAEGLKYGYSFPRVMKMVRGELGTGMKNIDEADIERMYQNLLDPHSATDMGAYSDRIPAGDVWRSITNVEGAFGSPLRQLRESMRAVREADPELYETLKNLSRDVERYGYEP